MTRQNSQNCKLKTHGTPRDDKRLLNSQFQHTSFFCLNVQRFNGEICGLCLTSNRTTVSISVISLPGLSEHPVKSSLPAPEREFWI